MDQRVAIDRVFTPDVSSSPDHDLFVKRVVSLFFSAAKTKHFPARVPNDDHRNRLDTPIVRFHFIPRPEAFLVNLAELSDQIGRLWAMEKALARKGSDYGLFRP